MHKRYVYLSVASVIGLALLGARLLNNETMETKSTTRTNKEIERTIIPNYEMFYDELNYWNAIHEVEHIDKQDNIRMIVVPHHLLVAQYISEMMHRASGRNINSVFIIGANHENAGTTKITTGNLTWDSPAGQIHTNQTLTKQFMESFDLTHDPEPYIIEHSIGALVPFVHHYFPNAQVVPAIVAATTDREDVKDISAWIQDYMPEDSLVIVSADFSHYLPKEDADKKDAFTKALIEERDIDEIVRLHNTDYVDSPASLAVALQYANDVNLKTNIIHHDNSFNHEIHKSYETTSYFVMTFTEE